MWLRDIPVHVVMKGYWCVVMKGYRCVVMKGYRRVVMGEYQPTCTSTLSRLENREKEKLVCNEELNLVKKNEQHGLAFTSIVENRHGSFTWNELESYVTLFFSIFSFVCVCM